MWKTADGGEKRKKARMDRGARSIEIHWLKAHFFRNREGAFCRSVPACVAKEEEALFLSQTVCCQSLSTGRRRRRRLKRLRQQCREKGERPPASNSLVAGGSRFSGDSDSPLSLSSSGSQERPRMLYGERERELEAKERRRLPPLFSFANTLSPTFFKKRKK